MLGALLLGFHVVSFAQFAFSVYYDFNFTIVPKDVIRNFSAYGGKFKFLTFWDAIIQAVFFLLCILNDIYGTNKVVPKETPLIRRIKDYFHATFSFPLAMFVGITFWALMFIDRELVLPKVLDPYFPWWLNHLMHTMIMVSTVFEMLIAPRQYPEKKSGYFGLYALMLTYLVWIHVVYYKSGVWVYPVMEILSFPLRILFFVTLFVFVGLLYYAGNYFDNLIWAREKSKHYKKSASKSK
ncbi:androgen-induced gene 1 protein [Microplitis demolitor]|uniref:androgen-induced gene 1 protein n=1 Tax=Microplitis demolitor TaxID=69319 RepID=UPI0004CD1C1A|nr:androgen-induced gene 1 protein [Microplitis demolitor]XP_008551342.1 androgen-induced gene 1 protein [Microplitis demolitor]XP_008551343.1 androgen-induced gene 1 protein [Microplitis demolitor]XP_008551344.1 androgen-induced gene 1 protein [Microplitis demolitor]